MPSVFVRPGARGPNARVPHRITNYAEEWRAATVKAGCPGRIPHDLRRTAIRNAVRNGTSQLVAMVLSGHKTRSVFDRYDITSPADLRDARERLDLAGLTEGD
jgi:integrase